MTEPASDFSAAATFRDLRRARPPFPQPVHFEGLAKTFLPMVCGVARLLVPENPASVERVASAVFQTLAFRWRRAPRKALVGTWLLRTAWFASLRERKLLGLPGADKAPASAPPALLFKTLLRLKPRLLNAWVLRRVLGVPAASAAQALKCRETRLEKRVAKGGAQIEKALRKKKMAAETGPFLAGLAIPPLPETAASVLTGLADWSPKQPKTDLTRATLIAWRWAAFRLFLKRLGNALSGALAVIGLLAIVFFWLADRGYLTAWFIENGGRNLAKQFPAITQPARPWPVTPADMARVPRQPPKNAAELYSLTNIWPAQFTFTAAQWKAIQPSRIQPVPHLMANGGKIVLRNPNAKRSGLAGAVGIEFNWADARVEFAGLVFTNASVRFRGNGTYLNSLYGPKQSFKLDVSRSDKKRTLAGVHTLNFVNAVPDNSYMRDALAERLFRDLGVPGPRTAYSYLTVDAPGKLARQPLGLYVLVENMDGDFAADRFGSKKTPIFKPVTYDLFKDLGPNWKDYADIYDLKTKATETQLDRVIQLSRLTTGADDREFARRLPEFLDISEFAAFVAGHVIMSSYDGFLANGQNYYLYLDPRSNKFGFISWDQDHGWGEFGYVGTSETRERASIWHPSAYQNHFLHRVMKVKEFRDAYRGHLERALAELFTVERLYGQIDSLAAVIRPAVAAESDFRLERFEQSISTNWLSGPRDGQAEGPGAPVRQLKRFIVNRIQSVRAQLDGKSEGVALGGFNQ